mmetsp:Transcript_5059/g.5756  ORF Transcript_5059/g.5756 Transcript_5059/m.5756 type:complete len:565 (-) Transcript_5059:144-1838(-)|eukprot:CAMPEP_0205818760 /NCGR_PEP_ID=MMETSP0206-20130828/796_1 /ASSEMBLY_ACC=CAM_ASM_000279 /TAXON_ID=36767 /ORGANISM="Euplotes focardii, Strain TN1" /LENGTH=564 /DNA_ID=CAMNT_0053111467 /DNA_START=25 /DNA_END=1719 /DNA_ORIENTATION=+
MAGVDVAVVETKPHEGQRPGTSGLRKKVTVFQQENYLENFIQSVFDALPADEFKGCTLVLSGDGRYYNKTASDIIIRMAAANGVKRVIVGIDFLMSTPAVSAIIRKNKAYGGIILTASHNPGGPKADFGVKYNIASGGPAPSSLTNAMYDLSGKISQYKIATTPLVLDVSTPGETRYGDLTIEVVDAAKEYVALMKTLFDFPKLKAFCARPDFSLCYDSMHGVAGPFAKEALVAELGIPLASLVGATPLEDFGGGHPDPNLTYAHDLVNKMGLGESKEDDVPEFGAAADGDADRNMILGKRFFVTPSDSVAIIAAHSSTIPYFAGGLKGVARSMPTSGALDRVAAKLGVACYEVPTGWKFFGNLMDAGRLSICGEESFGTGSDHIREKDGLWAVLCWLTILADQNKAGGALVGVETIVRNHWKAFGRNYYSRYDYEEVESAAAKQLMAGLVALTEKAAAEPGYKMGSFTIGTADEFSYTDPVDQSVASHQGIRFIFDDGSRIIFRLSGTGSVGATIRLYVEKYESDPALLAQETQEAVAELISIALDVSNLEALTGRKKPTVIT